MWRIYYYPNTGIIKYQINIEAASQMEPMPFVDFPEKQELEGLMIDTASKRLIPAPPFVRPEPTFDRTSKVRVREWPSKL